MRPVTVDVGYVHVLDKEGAVCVPDRPRITSRTWSVEGTPSVPGEGYDANKPQPVNGRAEEVVADALLLESVGDEEIGWKAAVRLARHAVKALSDAGLLCESAPPASDPLGPECAP